MLYLNVLQLIWHYFLLPFYYNLLHSYCNLLLLLFFTAVYYFLLQVTTFLPQVTTSVIKILKKKIYQKLLQFTAIYCNFTAIYNNNLLHLVLLQFYFLLFRHRNTDYFLLRYYYNLLQFTAFTIFYCILLQVTAIYCELPRFTAQVGPQWNWPPQDDATN